MRVAIGLLSAGRRELMRVAIGLLSAGRRGLMRVAIGLLSAGRRELMRVAIGLPSAAAGGQGADGQQPEHAARPMCMRMLVRIRGYVSTSSFPALRTCTSKWRTAAAGRRVVFASCIRCDLHDCAWSGRPLSTSVFCGQCGGVGGAGLGARARGELE